MRKKALGSEHPNSPKKQREGAAFRALSALDPSFSDAVIRLGRPGEEPDFVVTFRDKRRIGVEVVELFHSDFVRGVPAKAQEVFTHQAAQHFTEECNRAGLSNVLASVEFDFKSLLRKSDISNIARRVVELIQPAATGTPTVHIWHKSELPYGVRDIWAHHRVSPREAFVGVAWGGEVSPIEPGQIQRCVHAKERKFNDVYQTHYPKVWLLILVDPYQAASMVYVPSDFRIPSSAFERIVVLQGWSRVVELWRAA